MSPAKATKAKINKWEYITLKRFCRVKEATNKNKKQCTEKEKIFSNDIFDKGLTSKKTINNSGGKGTLVYCWQDYKIGVATMGNSMAIPQKIKNRTTV